MTLTGFAVVACFVASLAATIAAIIPSAGADADDGVSVDGSGSTGAGTG
jgi:hypothetical protein